MVALKPDCAHPFAQVVKEKQERRGGIETGLVMTYPVPLLE